MKKRPDGKNYILELNKRNELIKFIQCIEAFIHKIPCMHYKINIESRLIQKREKLLSLHPNENIIMPSLHVVDNSYSKEDELKIIQLKKKGLTDQKIADLLNRSYWGIVDKIRRLRKEEKL